MSEPPKPPVAPTSKPDASAHTKPSSISASSTQPKPLSHPAIGSSASSKPAASATASANKSVPPATQPTSAAPAPKQSVASTPAKLVPQTTTTAKTSPALDSKIPLKSSLSSKTNIHEPERQRSVVIDEKAIVRRSLADTDEKAFKTALTSFRRKEELSIPVTPPQTPALSLSSSIPDLPEMKEATLSTSELPRSPPPPVRGASEKTTMTAIREKLVVLDQARPEETKKLEKTKTGEMTKHNTNEARSSSSGGRRSRGSDMPSTTANRISAGSPKPHEEGESATAGRRKETPAEKEKRRSSNMDRSKRTAWYPSVLPSDLSEPIGQRVWPQQDKIVFFVPQIEENIKPTASAQSSEAAKARPSTTPAPPAALTNPTSPSTSTPKAPPKVPVTSSEPSKATTSSTTPKLPLSTQKSALSPERRQSALKNTNVTDLRKRSSLSTKSVHLQEEDGRMSCSETRRKSVTYDSEDEQDNTKSQPKVAEGRKSLVSPPPTPTASQPASYTLLLPPPTSPPPSPVDEAVAKELNKEQLRRGVMSLSDIPDNQTPTVLQRPKHFTIPGESLISGDTSPTGTKPKAMPTNKESGGSKSISTKTPQKDARRTSKVEKERPRSQSEAPRRASSVDPHRQIAAEDRRKTVDGTAARPATRPEVDATEAAKSQSSTAPETHDRHRSEDPQHLDILPHLSGPGPGTDHLPHSSPFPTEKITDYAVTEGTTSYLAAADQASPSGGPQSQGESKASPETPTPPRHETVTTTAGPECSAAATPAPAPPHGDDAGTDAAAVAVAAVLGASSHESGADLRRGPVPPDQG